jgi:hypothetical protein
MKFILEFNEYSDRESQTRTKGLSKEEFLQILKKECSQFSFSNDQLYRRTNKSFGKFGLFLEAERKGTIGKYSYTDFFDMRRGYPVPRYKSLIGSTSLDGAAYFGSESTVYLVIPFDNSEIVFAGSPDLAIWSKSKQEFTDDLFILEKYKSNFKIPINRLEFIRNTSSLSSYTSLDKYGFEFFTNSSCLLLDIKEIDWLKEELNSYIKENSTYKNYLSYNELEDIMFEITDEFPELEWYVEESKYSYLLKEGCSKSFMIELLKNKDEYLTTYSDEYLLYYLEPKIFTLISEISNKLGMYNLYVSASDFGETDESYEIVISEIGHKPLLKE